MKLVVKVILIILLAYLLQLLFPWWSIAIAALTANLLMTSKSSGNAFFSGFLAVFILWTFKAYLIDAQTQSVLSDKIASLFFLPNGFLLIPVTGLVGGLVAGFAGLTGFQFIKMLKSRKKRGYYR